MKRATSVLGGIGVLVLLTLFLASCGGGGSSAAASPPYIEAMLISTSTGSLPNNFKNATVFVQDTQTGADIKSATVTMNAVPLPYNTNHQEYEGVVAVAPGQTVTVNITVGGTTFTASAVQFPVTSYPNLTAPLPGATWYTYNTQNMTWTGDATVLNTTVYAVGILNAADPNGNLLWPADTLAVSTGYSESVYLQTAGSGIALVAYVKGESIPNAYSRSIFIIGGFDYAAVTIN